MFFVYLLECADQTYYVGATNDLARRLHQHNHSKKGAHYTKIRRPVMLRYAEQYPTLKEARARESEIKKWKREDKANLFSKK